MKRALRASWAFVQAAKCQRPYAARARIVVARAVDHRAARCKASALPRSPAKRLSLAQNEGRNGVTGDCSVAKKAVRSGSDWMSSRRSGRMKRSSITSATANTRPISISTSLARRAGKTLTRPSVTIAPRAQGMTTNGSRAATAVR